MNYVFPTTKITHYRFPTHTNDLVMDRSEATCSEVFIVILAPGEAPPRHKHEDTEQIFFIQQGQGRLEIGNDETTHHQVSPGDIVRIPLNTYHRIFNTTQEPLQYLAIDCFPTGRPHAEPTWDSHVRVMCQNNNWNYAEVRK